MPNPQTEPNVVMKDISMETVEWAKLDEYEIARRGDDIYELMNMAALRETSHPQFDGMGYSIWNQTNEMADMSFLPPKKNKMDSRIVTGATHEKDTTLLSLLTNFNFEVRVRAYDSDQDELNDLGNTLTSLIRKSREMEDYDDKRALFYRNLIVQGTTFIREKYVESYIPKKVITSNTDDLDQITWTEAGVELHYDGATSELVDGKKVFLKDIRQWDIKKQPVVHTVEYIPRDNAKAVFGNMSRWKNVPKKITPTAQATYLTLASIYSDWTFAVIDDNKVEVWEVFDYFNQRYQLYLNGVPMLPLGFPLTAVSPSGCIPLAKGDLDRMNLFAYSKSIPSKTKIPQAVWDEVLRVMLVKFKQGAFVPRGNNSNKVLSENIYMPGRFTPDISLTDLPALIEQPGLTQADFNFFNLLKATVDDVSLSSSLQGNSIPGMTATEYLDMQKKQIMKLGGSIDAIINWEKQMAHLRLTNLIANWTNAIDMKMNDTKEALQAIYRTIPVEDTFEDGKKGIRNIKFTTDNYEGTRTPEDVYDEEHAYAMKKGKDIRNVYVNPKLLKAADLTFFYEIIPTDKNNDKLTQMVFINNIMQAMQIFGPQSLNVEYLKKRYAQIMGEDTDKFFVPTQPGAPAMVPPNGMPQPGATPPGAPAPSPMNQNMNPLSSGISIPQPNMNAVKQM